MRFRNFDSLRIFCVVARHGSFSSAALELNLTKGAVSYQIRELELVLGFDLFDRFARGVSLAGKDGICGFQLKSRSNLLKAG
jgi:DNA-binding transcriptional LysR family regulator